MPAYRFRSEKYISRGFKDFAISFSNNPTTKDFGMVKNENAIKQSVRNLISTIFGERPFQPDIGSRVKGLLFENFDPFSVDAIAWPGASRRSLPGPLGWRWGGVCCRRAGAGS